MVDFQYKAQMILCRAMARAEVFGDMPSRLDLIALLRERIGMPWAQCRDAVEVFCRREGFDLQKGDAYGTFSAMARAYHRVKGTDAQVARWDFRIVDTGWFREIRMVDYNAAEKPLRSYRTLSMPGTRNETFEQQAELFTAALTKPVLYSRSVRVFEEEPLSETPPERQ